LKFAQAYPVVLLARSAANYEPIVNEINSSGGKALGISTDVSDTASVSSAFKQISSEFGDKGLAAAVFNVGGRFVRKPFLELSEEDFAAGFDANGLVTPKLAWVLNTDVSVL
jgi:NAD(P)-dependent dehydrogenase (short-subunit alcohol dehydrogenase family)